jgi:hypothetical protein
MARSDALLAVLVAGCIHGRPAERAPADPKQRERAEFVACQNGTLPGWLDDKALAEASRLDRWSTFGSDPLDSFRAGTLSAQPSLPPGPGGSRGHASRYEAAMDERREFQRRCDLLRTSGQGVIVPPHP